MFEMNEGINHRQSTLVFLVPGILILYEIKNMLNIVLGISAPSLSKFLIFCYDSGMEIDLKET